MVSTPTPGLRLELIADGEASNTWGRKTNTNLSTLDRAVSGHIDYPMVDGVNTVPTTIDYQLGDWHHLAWRLTGTLTAPAELVVPLLEKEYLIQNATTGGFHVTVRPPTGSGMQVPPGQRALLLCDEVNIIGTVLQTWTLAGDAIGAITSAGLLTRKSDGSWLPRDIVGTDEQITVTNGNGDAGPPTLSFNTNMVAPGTVRVRSGLYVDDGGVHVSAGGLFVEAGGGRFAGPQANIHVASSTGAGLVDISGPSGAVLDLKDAEVDDFDLRIYTSGHGGGITTAGGAGTAGPLALTVPGGQQITMTVGTTTVAAVVPNGLGVYTGLIDAAVNGNFDSQIAFRNAQREWSLGVRGGGVGAFSVRSNGVDVVVMAPTGELVLTKGLTIGGGGLSVTGNLLASGGFVDFRGQSSFQTKGFADDAQSPVMWVRNSGNVGINSSLPQLMLHLGGLGSTRNASTRLETGGPAGARAWDYGVNYGEFNFFINDATAGARRFVIDTAGRVTVTAGLTVSAGSSNLNGGLSVSNGATIAGGTTLSKAGGSGHSLTIQNSGNTTANGCQVFYNGTSANVFTRVDQSNGDFDFVNSSYASIMLKITQPGACFNPTGVYGTLSDIRLKENVGTARGRIDDLMRLRVVDYSLRSEKRAAADRIGLIAQEVRDVMPELVFETGPHDGVEHALAVSTSTLTPMLLGALQDINRRLAAVEDVLNA